VLALIVAALVAVASLPSYPTRWARPAQIGVAVLAAVALIAAPEPTTGLVLLIVILLVVAEVALEVARRRSLPAEGPIPPSPGLASTVR
jgi:chromate transport protein ChrA